MSELVDFIRAELDTDERLARDLDGACWHIDICGDSGHNFFDALDSDRLLAEVQSKRAILDWLDRVERYMDRDDMGWHRLSGAIDPDDARSALAEPYRSRPGFRKEWKWTT